MAVVALDKLLPQVGEVKPWADSAERINTPLSTRESQVLRGIAQSALEYLKEHRLTRGEGFEVAKKLVEQED